MVSARLGCSSEQMKGKYENDNGFVQQSINWANKRPANTRIRTHAHNEKVEFDREIEKQNEKTGNNACAVRCGREKNNEKCCGALCVVWFIWTEQTDKINFFLVYFLVCDVRAATHKDLSFYFCSTFERNFHFVTAPEIATEKINSDVERNGTK